MATSTEKPIANNLQEDNPKKTLDLTLPPTDIPDPDPSQDLLKASSTQTSSLQPPPSTATSTIEDSLKEGGQSKPSDAPHDASLSDVQKKIRRAERFGISVQLSEKEKRNTRAERFGTGSTLQASDTSKSEELKRKARAERFGMPCPSTAADEESKKKARLARFASVPKTDPLEEDKRKARALRFSNPPSSSLSQVNGKGDIEPKAAVAGKAGGGT